MKEKKIIHKNIWKRWEPRAYLDNYFNELGPDVEATTKFVTEELKKIKSKKILKVLEFGSGPTIVGVVGVTPYTQEIHIVDYLEKNLEEIRSWLKNKPKQPDYSNIIRLQLELEKKKITPKLVEQRTLELRKKIKIVERGDAGLKNPLIKQKSLYPVIISLYCADSITCSKVMWRKYMENILSLLAPSGTLIIAALRKAKSYKVGAIEFPSANIDTADLKRCFLENGFKSKDIKIRVVKVPQKSHGFTGLLFATAKKYYRIQG